MHERIWKIIPSKKTKIESFLKNVFYVQSMEVRKRIQRHLAKEKEDVTERRKVMRNPKLKELKRKQTLSMK